MQCHEPRYETKDHHFHTVNTEGAQCINCHMTGQYYMVNDFRRNHSFRVPRPHLTTETGAPNACNQCHIDKSPQWASKVLGQWYGEKTEAHYSEILARGRSRSPQQGGELVGLIKDRDVPAIVRATAIYYLGDGRTRECRGRGSRDHSPAPRRPDPRRARYRDRWSGARTCRSSDGARARTRPPAAPGP